MAIKTIAELKAQTNAVIRVNGNKEITPPKHNELFTNGIDSWLNIADGGMVIQSETGYDSAIPITEPYAFVYKDWVESLVSGLGTYLGTWDANTNTPTITSGVGVNGDWYIVSVAGSTLIDGENSWAVGDKILFNGSTWEKVSGQIIDLTTQVTGILPVANGGTGTDDRTLLDSLSVLSIDWENRNLQTSSGDLSIDWENGQFYAPSGIVTIDSQLAQLYRTTGTLSLDFNQGIGYTSGGNLSFNYSLGYGYYGVADGGGVSINWLDGQLSYPSGNPSILWKGGILYDSSGLQTVDYANRTLFNNWTLQGASTFQFSDLDDSNYVRIKASDVTTADYTITLPSAAPLANTYLKFDGLNYSWSSVTTGLSYQGTWNANTNTPTITSGVGVTGDYYVVSVAGTTSIDGINDWGVNDWIIFNGSAWQKIDNSEEATVWGSITGTITNQTDLITYLSTNYLTSATAATTYLKLDASNGPLTGTLTTRNVNIQTGYALQFNSTNIIQVDLTNNNFLFGDSNYTISNGRRNAFIGTLSGNVYNPGSGNGETTGIGFNSLKSLTTAIRTTALGSNSGELATASSYSIFVGYGAGSSVFTGVGVTTEQDLTIIGARAGIYTASIQDGIALGREATLRGSNQFVVGSVSSPIYEFYLGRGNGIATSFNPAFIRNTGYPQLVSNQSSSGADLFLDGSPARGTGTASNVGLRYAVTGASGTTLQSVTEGLLLWGNTGNIGFWDATSSNFGGGTQVMFIKNAGTVPTTNPTNGIIEYVESGIIKFRNPSGTISSTSPLVSSVATTASLTIDASNTNLSIITALGSALTVNAPTGTITQGRKLIIRIKDNGTARLITWDAIFRGIGVTLPTTTVISKYLYIGFIYNETDSKWDAVAVNQEA